MSLLSQVQQERASKPGMRMKWPWKQRPRPVESITVFDLSFLSRETDEDYLASREQYLTYRELLEFRADAHVFGLQRRGEMKSRSGYGSHLEAAFRVRAMEGQDALRRRFAVDAPVDPHTGRPASPYSQLFLTWKESQSKPALDMNELQAVELAAIALQRHRLCREVLSAGVPWGVARENYCGMPCQSQIDWVSPRYGIVAVLLCDALAGLPGHVRYLGQAHRLAFYRAIVAQQIGVHMPVHVVAVERREPWRAGVWLVDPKLLSSAERENERLIGDLRRCLESDSWPTGYEELQHLRAHSY